MSEQLIQTPGTFGENGNFLLERELGIGGMGGVFMGRDKMLDRPVAVKIMLKELGEDAEFVEKFKKEAQSAARLIHPNIAQVYSYGICDGMPYIAMELASGGSLYTIMNANPGKTDVARVIKICQQVAQALQCASDQGCVHGDVKPENILLDANGNAKLVDFGLAAMQKDTSEIWGTPYYISPEKVKKEPIDFRADMYSLGGTLYHALTGVAPFEGEDSVAVVKKRFEGMPKKPSEIRPDLTPAIDNLVMTMLAEEKENRFPSFEALLEAFRAVMTTGLTGKLPTPGVSAPTSGARRPASVNGRRMVMKRPGASAIRRKLEEEGNEGAADGDVKSLEDADEDEEGGNLGLKVAGIVVGVILLVGGVIGGLLWYQAADKKARAAEEQSQIAGGVEKARGAIRDTVASAVKFADDCDQLAAKAIENCQKSTDEIKKIIPAEWGALLKPAPSKELLEAIAATNGSPVAAAPAAAPVATNAAVKAAVSNAAPAKASAPAATNVVAAAAGKAEKAVDKTPSYVTEFNDLWNRAYGCQACAVRIRQAVLQLVNKAREADALQETTRESMEKLAALSRTLVDMFEQAKVSKDVENVKKGNSFIKSKGENIVQQTKEKIRIQKLEDQRRKQAEDLAAKEKERQEKIEAAKKAKIEAETASSKAAFEAIVGQGCLRQLDWSSALRQLKTLKDEMTTAEGQLAVDLEMRKITDMKKVQDVFVKGMGGYAFRGKLKGCKVATVTAKEISLTRGDGKTMKLTWQKFYKDYPGNLNELINTFIVSARNSTAKHKLNLSEWADAMTGAALTMQLVCSEVNGAVERAETLAKETVKQFPEYQKTAEAMFPDITFEAAEE